MLASFGSLCSPLMANWLVSLGSAGSRLSSAYADAIRSCRNNSISVAVDYAQIASLQLKVNMLGFPARQVNACDASSACIGETRDFGKLKYNCATSSAVARPRILDVDIHTQGFARVNRGGR